MCLILLSVDSHPTYRLILAANRDEFFDRPTEPLAFWPDAPDVLAGRDLKNRGTWLAVSRSGRLAALTNYREPGRQNPSARSRGLLISDFVSGSESPHGYLERIQTNGDEYNGFNLIVGDETGLYYYSNRGGKIQPVEPGIHGLSNRLLDTPWPKVELGKSKLQEIIETNPEIREEALFRILEDRHLPPDDSLPDTGVGLEWERMLSPLFITSDFYGTRSSSVILIDRSGRITFSERTFSNTGSGPAENEIRRFFIE